MRHSGGKRRRLQWAGFAGTAAVAGVAFTGGSILRARATAQKKKGRPAGAADVLHRPVQLLKDFWHLISTPEGLKSLIAWGGIPVMAAAQDIKMPLQYENFRD